MLIMNLNSVFRSEAPSPLLGAYKNHGGGGIMDYGLKI